jgi:nitroreductase
MNSVLATIAQRRSVRMFTSDPVKESDIETVLQAANQAPSAHNQQSWRFIVIKGQKKEQIVNTITKRANSFPRPSSTLLRMAARSMAQAPVVIAIANTGNLIEHGTELFKVEKEMGQDFFRTMEIQSSAAAVQNLLLAAHSLGLASVWLGILFLMKDEVLQILEEPKGEFMAVVPIGYPAKVGKGPLKRPLAVTTKWFD